MPAPLANPCGPVAKASPATPPPKPPSQVLAIRIAFVSAGFCLVLAVGLLVGWIQYQRTTPLDAVSIATLKAQLLKAPRDEQLKEQIRAEDLRLRTAHSRYLASTRRGTWLLLGGAAVLIASLQIANWRKKLCVIKQPKQPGAEVRAMFQAGAAVLVLGAFLGGGALWLAHASPTFLTADLLKPAGPGPGGAQVAAAASSFPSPEELQRNWPRFRGPDGCASSTATNVPLNWDTTNGLNIVWKVPVPAPGFGSPIIWGDRLFISGGTPSNRTVFCFDAKSGALTWQRPVEPPPGSPPQTEEVPEQTGMAAATMATDGRRVYAIFASGELAAFSLDGTPAWTKSLAPIKNSYGHAASLLTWKDRLILQLDQGELEEKKSKIYAFDGASGKIVWQQPRASGSSWSSPIVINAAGKEQIITLGIPYIISHDFTDGKELWRVEGMGGEVTPSPIFGGALVLAISPSDKLMAIRPDGQGDVTKTHLAWKADEGIPDVTSPVSNAELVFLLNSGGLVTCYELKTGKKVWEHDFETEFQASPTIIGANLYLLGAKGPVFVVQAGREFKQLARSDMDDKFYASPAIVQNRIYLRGLKNLYCIGAKDEKAVAVK